MKSFPRCNVHVMVAVGTYMQAVSQFTMEQHGVTLRAFGPKIFWNITSRKN